MTEHEFLCLLDQRLSDLADVLILYYDPCGVGSPTNDTCRRGHWCCYGRHFLPFNESGVCPLLGESGCTVKRASCKLWFCETALRAMDPKCLDAFRVLEGLVKLYELGGRPWLGQRYVGRTDEIAGTR